MSGTKHRTHMRCLLNIVQFHSALYNCVLACMVATISIIDHDLKPSHFRAFTDLLETYSFRAA